MIARVWRGWTTREDADAYEDLLRDEILPQIESRGVSGYQGFELLRRDAEDEVEFMTVMRFDSLDAVRDFAGEDHERAYVPSSARELLARFDDRSRHYVLRETRDTSREWAAGGEG